MPCKSHLLAGWAAVVLALVSLLVGAPTTSPAPTSRPAAATQPAIAEEDEVLEAVFRYQFEHNESAQKQTAAVYYLSLLGREKKDPDDAFMKRFIGHKPPVRKLSERDAPGADRGLTFDIETIKWASGGVSSGKVEVLGGYYESPDSAAGGTYTVEKVNGQWKVTGYKMGWIA
jgi:hypothetical protein